MVIFFFLAWLPLWLYSLILVGITLLGIWAATAAEQLLDEKDASCIVIDEIAGILLACIALPIAWLPLLIAFALFRFFDIVKPLPQLETVSGGWGVMLDDLFAGLLAQLGVRLLLLIV